MPATGNVLGDATGGRRGCPFRFFLKRGLGVRPVDERERDKDVWLDPLTRGSELHELYAELLRRTRDSRPGPTEDRHAWLRALAEARLAELHARCRRPRRRS